LLKKSQEEMMADLYVVMMGIPGTDDRGLVGDVKDIKNDVRRINGDTHTNTAWRKAFCFIIPVMAAGLGFCVARIFG